MVPRKVHEITLKITIPQERNCVSALGQREGTSLSKGKIRSQNCPVVCHWVGKGLAGAGAPEKRAAQTEM